jgi:hypothetical protein
MQGITPKGRLAERFAVAGRRADALWVQAACLAAASALAALAVRAVPEGAGDVLEARRLGIISATTIAGVSKSHDTKAYALALAVGVLAAVGLWAAWCLLVARPEPGRIAGGDGVGTGGRRTWTWTGVAILAACLLPGLLRFDLATNGWDAPYTFYSEEGEALTWAHVVLHGGVLSRDVYCLYGPLATAPLVAVFKLFGTSVRLGRLCIYLLDLPALLAVYVLLRELARTRITALLGVGVVLFDRMWPMPAMSWSLLRTGIGLAAIAALARSLRSGSARGLVVSGAAVGVALFFSQEAGVAAVGAIAAGLAIDLAWRRPGWKSAGRDASCFAAGVAATTLPVIAWAASHGALPAMLDNLFGFARLRVLGHGAQPFPTLWGSPERDELREILAAYFGPVLYAFAAFRLGTRILRAPRSPEVAVQAAVIVYGIVLFASPLSRPDPTHVLFAMPPAFVLAVLFIEQAVAAIVGPGQAIARRSAAAAFVALALAGLSVFGADAGENVALFARQVWLSLRGRATGPAEEGLRTLDLPRGGGIRVPRDRADEIESVVGYVRSVTAANEPFWAFPNEPMLNVLADRPLSNPYPLSLFAVTRAQRADLIAALEGSGTRYAVVNEKPTIVDGIPSRDAVPELWSYLEARFVPERRFGRFVVMRRGPERPGG